MLKVEQLSKHYRSSGGQVRSLEQIDLQVSEGEFLVVRGHSGSGKTTLLLALGAMLRPTLGKVWFQGKDLYGLGSSQRASLRATQIGFVFQMFHLVHYVAFWSLRVSLPDRLAMSTVFFSFVSLSNVNVVVPSIYPVTSVSCVRTMYITVFGQHSFASAVALSVSISLKIGLASVSRYSEKDDFKVEENTTKSNVEFKHVGYINYRIATIITVQLIYQVYLNPVPV